MLFGLANGWLNINVKASNMNWLKLFSLYFMVASFITAFVMLVIAIQSLE
jgi:hypothetical protein